MHYQTSQTAPSPGVSSSGVLESLRWPSAQARDWVERFITWCRVTPRVDAVIAIGSAVRGLGHGKSDLDLVVIYHGEPPAVESAPIDVDVRAFARDKVDEKLRQGHDLLDWAVRFGVAIWGRDRYWSKLVDRWRERLPWPSAAVADERAARTEQQARDMLLLGDDDAALDLVTSMLTHRARAHLLRAGVYPATRPELPDQLREIGEVVLAQDLRGVLLGERTARDVLALDATSREPAGAEKRQ